MFFLMQIIFIVLPSNMAAVENLYISQNIFSFWNNLYQTNAPLELQLGRPVSCAQVQLRS